MNVLSDQWIFDEFFINLFLILYHFLKVTFQQCSVYKKCTSTPFKNHFVMGTFFFYQYILKL